MLQLVIIDSKACKELDTLTLTAGYSQLIDRPTRFFGGVCSCINLIFCNKQELISEFDINHSLFRICHHNLIFRKVPVLQVKVEWCGTMKMQILRV